MLKSISLSLAALVASVSVASADVNFLLPSDGEQNRDSVIELTTVRAAADGVVEIYSYHADEIGSLLGSQRVFAGANGDVHIRIGRAPSVDAIALLKVNGEVVDSQDIHFN